MRPNRVDCLVAHKYRLINAYGFGTRGIPLQGTIALRNDQPRIGKVIQSNGI